MRSTKHSLFGIRSEVAVAALIVFLFFAVAGCATVRVSRQSQPRSTVQYKQLPSLNWQQANDLCEKNGGRIISLSELVYNFTFHTPTKVLQQYDSDMFWVKGWTSEYPSIPLTADGKEGHAYVQYIIKNGGLMLYVRDSEEEQRNIICAYQETGTPRTPSAKPQTWTRYVIVEDLDHPRGSHMP